MHGVGSSGEAQLQGWEESVGHRGELALAVVALDGARRLEGREE